MSATRSGPGILANGNAAVGRRTARADDGTIDWRDAEHVNVREYRIVGNTTDETTKWQALLDAIAARSVGPVKLVVPVPQGAYYGISDRLHPGHGQIAIEGAHRDLVQIWQLTANKPHFLWDDDTNGVRGIRVAHLTLYHANAPTSLTDQQYGIQFRGSPNGDVVRATGYWACTFEDLWIQRAYASIGLYSTGTGTTAIWSSTFRDLVLVDTLLTALKLRNTPGTGVVGQPNNHVENVSILNYDPTILNTSVAIDCSAANGWLFDNIDVEDWRDALFNATGGTAMTINNFRTERHRLTAAANVVYLANGQFALNGIAFNRLYQTHSSGVMRMIRADASAQVAIQGLSASRDADGSTTTQNTALLSGTSGGVIYADGVVDVPASNIKGFLPTATDSGAFGIVRYNGMPPAWDAAPTASATYRGRAYRAEGAGGVADVEYRCLKDAANAYNWKAAVTG